MRITVDAQWAELSTKRQCEDPNKWNSATGRIIGTKENSKNLNAYLNTLQSKSYDALRFFVEGGEIIPLVSPNKYFMREIISVTNKQPKYFSKKENLSLVKTTSEIVSFFLSIFVL